MAESPQASDAALLRLSRRDDTAFRAVYDRHAPGVHRFLVRRCGDREAALDLTSEVFARAWLGRRKFRDEAGGSALPWLLGIARNVLLASFAKQRVEDAARRKLGLEARDVALADNAEWLPGEPGEIEEALVRLSAGERDAISLRVLESRSYRDVAAHLGCSEGAARLRVRRGLDHLRALLEEAPL